MDNTKFGLRLAGIALLLAGSIAAVVVVAQRPHSGPAGIENRVSQK
jgi:hypothetical protein